MLPSPSRRRVWLGLMLAAAGLGGALLGSARTSAMDATDAAKASVAVDPYAWELDGVGRDSMNVELWHWLTSGLASSADAVDRAMAHERLADYWRLTNPSRGDAERARAQYWADRALESRPLDPAAWTLDGFSNPAATREEREMWSIVQQARQPSAHDHDRAEVHSLLARYYLRRGDKAGAAPELARALYWTRTDILHFGR